MLENYLPILLFLGIGVVLGVAPMVISALLAPRKPDAAKLSAFECGFPAFEDARSPYDIRFYLVAILFILFDLETAFLFPWAVMFDQIGWFGFLAGMMFLVLLLVGFIYEWKKGALEWE
jgi:NADH-quinone oxidoreductase subunit A